MQWSDKREQEKQRIHTHTPRERDKEREQENSKAPKKSLNNAKPINKLTLCWNTLVFLKAGNAL